ncbi:MAG TPA: hypothetical protein VF584_08915 [Longimicrobium sp.]|jgi:hypothetical protein
MNGPPNALPALVRILTAAFPREFRQRFGEDMLQCIRDARDALGDASATARAKFWLRIAIDLAGTGILEHVRSRRALSRSRALRLLGFASLSAAIGNVLVDLLSAELQMGIGALLLTAIGTILGAILARPDARPAP